MKTFAPAVLSVLGSLAGVAVPVAGGEIRFEDGIEYANPDGQHLQLNLARPKDGAGPFPAVLCIHGTKDAYVNYEQAEWIHERLKAADVEVELLTLQGAGHGFKGADAERAERAMFEFFAKRLQM